MTDIIHATSTVQLLFSRVMSSVLTCSPQCWPGRHEEEEDKVAFYAGGPKVHCGGKGQPRAVKLKQDDVAG
jgi:hypothetical protein